MSYTKRRSFLLLACAFLLCGARAAHACECMPVPYPPDEAYDNARVIVMAKVKSVNKAGREAGGWAGVVISAEMIVEQTFKGDIRAGGEMTFRSGGPGECTAPFDEQMIGERYLLYLGAPEENTKMWAVSICGRSTSVDRAIDDLSYLSRRDELSGRTRISGMVKFAGQSEMSVGGRVIRITVANKSHEVKTDERGFYEILDLPPGTYLIEADTPPGWKVGVYYPRSYTNNFDAHGEDQSPKRFQVVLGDKKHITFDVSFETDNAARGKT
jgi:hypothetical protein